MRWYLLVVLCVALLCLGGCNLFGPEDEDPDPYTGGTVSDVAFEIMGPASVKITWTENFADEDGFYVDRKLWDGEWERKILQCGPNETQVTDPSAVLGSVYYYKVYAFKGDRESEEEQVQYNFYLPWPQNVDYDFSWNQPGIIRFFWTNQAAWADSIVVAKRVSGGQWEAPYAVLAGNATEYTDPAYNVAVEATWGFTTYYQEHISSQTTITMMPPKQERK